ncbi:hypothetical protein GCM10027299_42050 [Larkinella ripae]
MLDNPEEIGKHIRDIRKSRGMTQKDLADKLGLAHPTIVFYEKGRNNFTVETLKKIGDALGYDLNVTFTIKKSS